MLLIFGQVYWLEASFNETATIEQLLVSHSYSSTYIQEALEKANHLGVKTANTFIMADSKEFKTPQSKQGADYSLHYLGQFQAFVKL